MSGLPEAIEIETGPAPTTSVIWLHGLGADGNDFVPIVEELDLPDVPIRFVFPHAPMQPVTINGGYVMRAWYDILTADIVRREDAAGVRASHRLVELLMEREVERGTPPSRIVLAGFSQGGAMAFHVGLRQSKPIAGIMALSTYVPLADQLAAEAAPNSRKVPIFFAHGTADPVVVYERAAASRQLLETMGYAVEWHEYPMPHSVCAAEIDDIGAWLRRVLAPVA
jgi:phospholipase/carboxylesterase